MGELLILWWFALCNTRTLVYSEPYVTLGRSETSENMQNSMFCIFSKSGEKSEAIAVLGKKKKTPKVGQPIHIRSVLAPYNGVVDVAFFRRRQHSFSSTAQRKTPDNPSVPHAACLHAKIAAWRTTGILHHHLIFHWPTSPYHWPQKIIQEQNTQVLLIIKCWQKAEACEMSP